jgi:tol-pal system protein YbgF
MLMNRLNDLESQVQQLSARVGGGAGSMAGSASGMASAIGAGPTAGAGAADLDVRLSQLQDQVRTLTGEVESQNNLIMQEKTENQRLNEDMGMRLNTLEAKVGIAAPAGAAMGQAAPQAGAPMYGAQPAGQQAPASGTLGTLVPGPNGSVPASAGNTAGLSPEKQYEAAYNLLGEGDYAGAEAGFAQFLQLHPKHPLAANAVYWEGETYFQRGMMDKATATFAQSYKQYPSGPKAPDSLLRLGMALGQSGKPKQGCVAFAELAKQFPAASQKIKTSLAQEKARYACE